MKTFQPGTTVTARSICDYECIFTCDIIATTPKTAKPTSTRRLAMKLEEYEVKRIERETIVARSDDQVWYRVAVGGPVFAMYQRLLQLEEELVDKQ